MTMYDPLKAKAKVVFYTLVAFATGLGVATGFGWTESSLAMPVLQETPQVSAAAVAPATSLSDAFVNVAEVVTPGVVRIEAERRVSAQELAQMQGFFRNPPATGGDPETRPVGGSGFLVSADGYILTNNHVVENAVAVRVYYANGRYASAEVVGGDPFTDVAVIKVPGETVPGTLSFGDSDAVRVGEWVLAIGNPGSGGSGSELDYSVTAGIVSAKGRTLSLLQQELRGQMGHESNLPQYAIEDFIQTDAVINPGNSGGPLVDMQGRVVGINAAISSPTGYYSGYGFAIPVNLARRVMQDLVEYGQVRRPVIGVSVVDVSADFAELYGLETVEGAVVQNVEPGGPADRAGIRQEDIIIAIEDEPIAYTSQLQGKVAMFRPGDQIDVTVWRDGREQVFAVRLEQAPINEITAEAPAPEPSVVERIGIGVSPLDDAAASNFGYDTAGGVIISRVQRGSPAQRQGLIEGQKLLEINSTRISDPADVARALGAVEPGSVVRFLIGVPDGSTSVFAVRMPR